MSKPMRILQVMAGGQRGGAETAFVDMCLAMQAAGQVVEVATRANDLRVGQLRDVGLRVHCLPFGGALDVYTPWRLRRIIRAFEPDVVQSWMSRGASKVPQWASGKRYVHVGRMGTAYKMKYFASCDGFAAITPDLRDYIIGHGVAADTVRQINNFADVEPAGGVIERAEYDTPPDAIVLLGLGRLHDDKAFDVLIKAVAQLPEQFYCWIAGEGPLRAELEALIAELGVEGRVKLLGWQSDRAALFAAADICTFISRDEGFGTVFVQCWASGLPVIVSDADGPRQFVRDGEDGLVVPIDDVSAVKGAVLRLAGDEALQAQFIEAGRARYGAEFTKESSVDGYLTFYSDLLARQSTS